MSDWEDKSLTNANELLRNGRYDDAIMHYQSILTRLDYSGPLSKMIKDNLKFAQFRRSRHDFNVPNVRDFQPHALLSGAPDLDPLEVIGADEARRQFEDSAWRNHLKPGITALIRAKNAGRFIEGAITSIIDIVDEVVAVDNYSQDNTFANLTALSVKYSNLKIYKYKIDIPKVGAAHAEAVASNSANTLGTYYNWCLSKVRTTNVLKWDADFVAVRKNLIELINHYDLRNSVSNTSIWCSGVTSFGGRVIRPDSWYDEFRIFSTAYGAKWENYRGCETIVNSINASDRCVVYGFESDTRSITIDELVEQKKSSKPIFIELKDSINLKSGAMILDARDTNDNQLIKKYINFYPDYTNPFKINKYKVLVTVPSLILGGGNYWAKLIYDQLSFLGIHVDVGINDCSKEFAVMSDNGSVFYDIPVSNLLFLSDNKKERLSTYTHILLSCPLNFPEFVASSCKVFVFTHSDVSYINQYVLDSGYSPVALNEVTIEKFGQKYTTCALLYNYLALARVTNKKKFSRKSVKMLYCNRISFDKNVPMLLLALRYYLDSLAGEVNIRLTLLAGGAEYSPLEFATIKSAITKLGLSEYVDLLSSQKDVETFYLSHDFCVLTSVSEGCSYGLLEAINYEIPVITTDIAPNVEVTGKCMPVFQLNNVRQQSARQFCINNYTDYLHDIGYVDNTSICQTWGGEATFIFNRLYSRIISDDVTSLSSQKPTVYVPYLVPNLCDQAIESEYIGAIKEWGLYDNLVTLDLESQRALLDEKINGFKSEYEQYMGYWYSQRVIFDAGAHSLAKAITDMIKNFEFYKSNVTDLRVNLKTKYFSVEENRKQLYSLLFSDDFLFE